MSYGLASGMVQHRLGQTVEEEKARQQQQYEESLARQREQEKEAKKANRWQSIGSIAGSALGGVGGFLLGGPMGAMAGASLGGGLGRGIAGGLAPGPAGLVASQGAGALGQGASDALSALAMYQLRQQQMPQQTPESGMQDIGNPGAGLDVASARAPIPMPQMSAPGFNPQQLLGPYPGAYGAMPGTPVGLKPR